MTDQPSPRERAEHRAVRETRATVCPDCHGNGEVEQGTTQDPVTGQWDTAMVLCHCPAGHAMRARSLAHAPRPADDDGPLTRPAPDNATHQESPQ